jgi:ADP-ribose pyrophosphatase YjhB (NUDIX family)
VVDPGEAPEVAAVRETKEEGGIDAEIEGLLGLQNLRREGWIALVFLCCHVGGEPRSDGGIETDAAGYFSLEDMEEFGEPFEPWCEWIVRRVLGGECHVIPPVSANPYHPRLAFL